MNKRRQASQLSTLEVRTIPLLEDDVDGEESQLRHAVTKEDKISSSGRRFDALGTLIRPVETRAKLATVTNGEKAHRMPYVIGLTGGIASGKTSVAKRLEKLGAVRIDCDALGHVAYEKVRADALAGTTQKDGELGEDHPHCSRIRKLAL